MAADLTTRRPLDDRDIVIAGLLDAVKYLLRDDATTAEQKLKAADSRFKRIIEDSPPGMGFSEQELHRLRQWFDHAQDTDEAFLDADDYALARRLYERLGMRVPDSMKR